jgi:hypothetical protein
LKRSILIANGQGFWGDSVDAPQRLLETQPDLDYLTLDYLAEVSLSILAVQRQQNPGLGYARDFLGVLPRLAAHWKAGGHCKVVANAGGLNPQACAEAVVAALRDAGCSGRRVGLVAGDDVLQLARDPGLDADAFRNLETGEPIASIADRLTTANAYLGAAGIVEALREGASVVVTGRVADPSLAVAPCVAEFGWGKDAYDLLASATVGGHIIECGAQATGGLLTDWLEITEAVDVGFPVLEMAPTGEFCVTKPPHTGGRVSLATVKEQLLYELGDPGEYLSPDCTASFLTLELSEEGANRVRVAGATGRAPSDYYKVSATYHDGYMCAGMLTIVGRDAERKARRSGEVILERVRRAGYDLARTHIEVLGAGDVVPGVLPRRRDALEVVLRVAVADPRREAVERFSKEIAPMVTGGAPGTTGYATGRPKVRPVYGYWPCLAPRGRVRQSVEILES